MTQRKQLFIHIGNYKTGTSALQRFLSDESDALSAHGILYPRRCRPKGNRTNHGLLAMSLGLQYGQRQPKWYSDERSADESFGRFHDEVAATDATNVLISSELFTELALVERADEALGDLADRLSDYDTRIVLYVREPLALAKSWFNQLNKGWRPTRNFPTFFIERDPRFLGQLAIYEAYANRFGAENMTVKTYRHVGQRHIEEFLSVIGCAVPVPDDLELVGTGQPERFLELVRLAKDRGRVDYDTATLTDLERPQQLLDMVARINDDYAQLAHHADVVVPSELSSAAIFDHYAALLEPLGQFPGFRFNQREATNLLRIADLAEALDTDLARALLTSARVIRPNDESIASRLSGFSSLTEPSTNPG